MTKLTWQSGAQGARAVPGSLVRWREVKRGPWHYAYYRGTERRSLTFSLTPDGPIFRWATYIGENAQVAVIVPTLQESETGEQTNG